MAAIRLSKSIWFAFALLNALLLALLFFLWQFRAERAELAQLNALGAAVYPEPLPLARITLNDQRGQPFGLEQMRGAWNLVFFGFSNCPDVCPLTLRELGDYYRDRGEVSRPPLNVLFVSVDPADTPEVIAEYLLGFHPNFIGLSGSSAEVNAFAAQMFVNTGAAGHSAHVGNAAPTGGRAPAAGEEVPAAAHTPAGSPEGFISHSIHLGLVNPEGELVALLRPPHRADDIAAALAMIFQRA